MMSDPQEPPDHGAEHEQPETADTSRKPWIAPAAERLNLKDAMAKAGGVGETAISS